MDQSYEMYIPFVYKGRDEESTRRRIFWVFKELNWGYISDVLINGFEREGKSVSARIKFSRMNQRKEQEMRELLSELDNGGSVEVKYESGKPWFWKVMKYVKKERVRAEEKVSYSIKSSSSSSSRSETPFKPVAEVPSVSRSRTPELPPPKSVITVDLQLQEMSTPFKPIVTLPPMAPKKEDISVEYVADTHTKKKLFVKEDEEDPRPTLEDEYRKC